ncbi:MAG: hypothetical protein IKL65_00780 [Bacilli bacterium]|nr:hypothetical protein [Bacilli bacterium]
MNNYENEVFGFSSDANEELEQASNFNYDTISGLGESDYENEDLFSTEVENNEVPDFRIGNYSDKNNDFEIFEPPVSNETSEAKEDENIQSEDDLQLSLNTEKEVESNLDVFRIGDNTEFDQEDENNIFVEDDSNKLNLENNNFQLFEPPVFNEKIEAENNNSIEEETSNMFSVNNNVIFEPLVQNNVQSLEDSNNMFTINNNISFDSLENNSETLVTQESNPVVEDSFNGFSVDQTMTFETPSESVIQTENSEVTQVTEDNIQDYQKEEEQEISVSDTPIEELNKLTEYVEEKIEETDINSLFDKVSINVKDASDIFRKNTDLKQKIDTRFEELKKLQSELENSRKKQLDEINKYKEDVLEKLTEKKEEIERRLNVLKELQSTLEKEKQEFEVYKKKEQDNIDKVQKEVQSAYDDRREELNHIEDVLRKQKDSLDEERTQLSLDKIQYESDKNELANNLLKFNELVNSFTDGVNDIKG